MAQADAALGVSDTGPIRTGIEGGRDPGASTPAPVDICRRDLAAQTATIFAGMVSNADDTGDRDAGGLRRRSGPSSSPAGGRSVVNAYSNGAGP